MGSLMSIECVVLRTSLMFFWKDIRNLYSLSLITIVVVQHWCYTYKLLSVSSRLFNLLKRMSLLHAELLAHNVAYQHSLYNIFIGNYWHLTSLTHTAFIIWLFNWALWILNVAYQHCLYYFSIALAIDWYLTSLTNTGSIILQLIVYYIPYCTFASSHCNN